MVLKNRRGTLFILKFCMAILIFIIFIGFVPALSGVIGMAVGADGLNCSGDFTLECLIMYFFMPAIAITILCVVLGYLYIKFIGEV